MNYWEELRLFDGSKGVMLQRLGLEGHEAAEEWNLSHPQQVLKVHMDYVEAGSRVIQTNTFPGNSVTLEKHGLKDKVYKLNFEGVRLAKEAAGAKALVAAAVGPTGEFLEPAGPLSFDDAVAAFTEQMQAICDAGADLVCFETFTDLQELRAGVTALKEVGNLPFICSLSFESACRTLSGNPAECCAVVLQSLGAIVVGANCSGGPDSLREPISRMYSVASVPLSVKPNAGLPQMVDGRTIYEEKPEDMCEYIQDYINSGVRLIGGCCGTTPAHIKAMEARLNSISLPELQLKKNNQICSAYLVADPGELHTLDMEQFKAELAHGDWEGLSDELMELDAALLDFGEGCPQIDMWELISNLCLTVRAPLGIKTADPQLLKSFLRVYPGRAAAIIPKGNSDMQEICDFYGALVL